MFKDTRAFSGFSVDDLDAATQFYGETLGLKTERNPMGLRLDVAGGNPIFVYSKDSHQPASFTILNFPVESIDDAVKELKDKGIKLEHYEGMTDDDGIARGLAAKRGPDIAWFTDPAGNILSVLQDK
jgi:predicted enzyme related to lactoylglutathione lyase